MKRILCIISLLTLMINAFGQSGEIYGTVTDETNNTFAGVVIKVTQGGIVKGGSVSEDDGTYSVKPLQPGKYDLEFSSTGYSTKKIANIIINSGASVKINCKMVANSKGLKEVSVVAYKEPVVSKNRVMSSSTIERAPTRNLMDNASLSSNVQQSRSGGALRIGGSRQDGTVYMIDGQVASGTVSHSAIPSNLGNNSGVISQNESYKKSTENDFRNVMASPLSTMSIDVDHASYANVRRLINSNIYPPAEAVRIEEMVNYFQYDYSKPRNDEPIALITELTECPWNAQNMLLKIGMKAKTISTRNLPKANIVFLIDVSGSMESENKLPLLKSAFKLLTDQLRSEDKVSIVVYAGNSGLVLPPTSGAKKQKIKDVLDKLTAGGSTAGGAGILLAYKIASENFIKGGNNRVVLATDGDFNVGLSSDAELEKLIVKEREKGIFLSCLGFGDGNYKDSKMETLADKGNGNYNYIDNIDEAKKTLVKEFGGTIFTIAKDVKTQIEFNPNQVKSYRLIGYENRLLNAEDFKDDKKDAGEMGSGHSVTILYELVPATGNSNEVRKVDELKYQKLVSDYSGEFAHQLATIKFRYKQPDGNKSKEIEQVVSSDKDILDRATVDTKFAASVAMFGMILSESQYNKDGTFDKVLKLANDGIGQDEESYRKEFIELVKKTKAIKKRND